MANATESLNTAIDRLQAALEDARDLPGWGVVLIVVVSVLSAIILLHAMALIVTGPCLWAMWRHRQQLDQNRLLADEIIDPDGGVEMSAVEEEGEYEKN